MKNYPADKLCGTAIDVEEVKNAGLDAKQKSIVIQHFIGNTAQSLTATTQSIEDARDLIESLMSVIRNQTNCSEAQKKVWSQIAEISMNSLGDDAQKIKKAVITMGSVSELMTTD